MARIKKRQRKKIHRKYLGDICYEASLSPMWREKLFQADVGEVFDFSMSDLMTLLKNDPMLRKYRLQFSVKVVPNSVAPLWLQDDMHVVFKYFAKEFPMIHTFSGNNPAVK